MFPSWFLPSFFGGVFTLAGAFMGAKIAGDKAVKVMLTQHELLKEEKKDEYNFAFKKQYIQCGKEFSSVKSYINRALKVKMSDNVINKAIESVQDLLVKITEIPLDLITKEKHESYLRYVDALTQFEWSLRALKLGIVLSEEELKEYKEVLEENDKILKE